MTQLTLGLDRDSGVVSTLFDERNEAVKALLAMAIRAAKKQGKYVGICGQGPSDHEDFAAWLMEQGIDSISLNPDTVIKAMAGAGGAKRGFGLTIVKQSLIKNAVHFERRFYLCYS